MRCVEEVLTAMEYTTVPDPVPELPDVIVIHSALDSAVQGQLDAEADTLILPFCAR